jgi:hypothetical protein
MKHALASSLLAFSALIALADAAEPIKIRAAKANSAMLRYPAANAIDVFGGGGTQAATLATLTDSRVYQVGDQTINNFYAKIDGDLFNHGRWWRAAAKAGSSSPPTMPSARRCRLACPRP